MAKKTVLRQTTMFVHAGQQAELTALAEASGLKTAQLVRLAISEYLKNHRE